MSAPASLYTHHFPEALLPGRLVRRYNRFLADVVLDSTADTVCAHCVNTGRMEGLTAPGWRVWLSRAADPNRRLGYTWELTELPCGTLVGTNTGIPNRLVRGLIEARALRGLDRWTAFRPEVRYGENSRVDFLLEEPRGRLHYVEVKNCHLVYPDGRGYFPDSVSERAARHLEELAALVREGHRATVVFTAQRGDCRGMRPSDLHDPAFAAAARHAAEAGVRFTAVRIRPTTEALIVESRIPVDLRPYPLARIERWREANREASGWVRVAGGGVRG